MPGKPGDLREPWELGNYLKFQEATGGAIYGIRTRKAITVTRRSRFFGGHTIRGRAGSVFPSSPQLGPRPMAVGTCSKWVPSKQGFRGVALSGA